MPRNFDERVEVLVPVKSVRIRELLLNHVMAADLRDTAQSWTLRPDVSYARPPLMVTTADASASGDQSAARAFNAQDYFASTPLPG
jgi:polyphosphate kinase